MRHREELLQLIRDNNGLILTKNVTDAGIPREYIGQLVESGFLIKVDRSSYIIKDGVDDIMYRLQAKYPMTIFSHETALYLHGLTDKNHNSLTLSVPAGYNSKSLKDRRVKVHYVKKELYEIGISTMKTPYGRKIKVYDLERTICDLLRNRNSTDLTYFSHALKGYADCSKKDLERLLSYGKYFRLSKVLDLYMTVLL